jgi:mannose-6-phosphate isomerase-like protein (cupin superfamily)
MNVLVSFFIFLIILFFYIHIIHQLKTSQDLEIYEMDYNSNAQLQEICEVKQPVLFEFKSIYPEFFEEISRDAVFSEYGSYDIKVKDTNDYYGPENSADYVLLSLQSSQKLFDSDPGSHYFSENNEEFMDESGLYPLLSSMNDYIKPPLTFQTKFDILFGSKNTCTPLRYHMNYRHFYIVHSGKITVKMTPWKSHKYLHTVKDYENYEFRSPMNVWKPQKEFAQDYEKIRFLEFEVYAGHVLYIPPYWWYSIQYDTTTANNMIFSATYNSTMNCVTQLPHYGIYFLQQANIYKKVANTKTIEIPEPIEPADEISAEGPIKIDEIVEKL